MKISKACALQATSSRPDLRFEDQQLTAFSGLVVFQALFARLDLARRLSRCFRHRATTPIFPFSKLILLLVVHLLLGYRRLRECRFYADDPLVLRVLGLRRLPDVSTISRQLAALDARSVEQLERLGTELVLERLEQLPVGPVTIDFDGSVIGTRRRAEGTAVGFNKKKKGQRSYYPLNATLAQTGQVLDVLHRSGNVHDSRGARAFIGACVARVQGVRPGKRAVEVRMDSAFYSDEILAELEARGVRYTVSVPFERFVSMKALIETEVQWRDIGDGRDAFERRLTPDSWDTTRRFVFVRTVVARQQKGPLEKKQPLQLDLFEPRAYGLEYKVIVTNSRAPIDELVLCHEGRGAQEGLFAEMKSESGLAYVPTRTWLGNRAWMAATVLAHNLSRELTMITSEPVRTRSAKRSPLWQFTRIGTVRRQLIQRAGRLIRPQGKLTLSMNANAELGREIEAALGKLDQAA